MTKLEAILGLNIRKYRNIKGLSQEQLAESIGIEPSSMSDIERGKRFPRPENLEKIAKELNVSYSALLVDTLIDPNVIKEDFNRRLEIVNNDIEKFNLAYEYLKVLTD